MSDGKLNEEERAELEALRAEKAARLQAEAEAAERAELDALRAEKEERERDAAREVEQAKLRERAHKAMEPDEDDLSMPLVQKVLLVAIVLLFIFAVWRIFLVKH